MNKEEILEKIKKILEEIPEGAEISHFFIEEYGEVENITISLRMKEDDEDILADFGRYISGKLNIDFYS